MSEGSRRKGDPELPGSPWPRSRWGEVKGPSGQRCFTAGRTAQILGVSERQVRHLSTGNGPLTRDPDLRPKPQVFLVADSVVKEARRRSSWPPSDDPPDDGGWQVIAVGQEHDLRALRQEVAELQAVRARLETDLETARRREIDLEARLADLFSALEAVARAAQARPPS